jgi:hypothetical protein
MEKENRVKLFWGNILALKEPAQDPVAGLPLPAFA